MSLGLDIPVAVPRPPERNAPIPSGPPRQMPVSPQALAVGLGVIGGAACGYWAYDHLAREGTTDKERRSMLLWAVALVAGYAAVKLVELDEKFVTVTGAAKAAEKYIGGATP